MNGLRLELFEITSDAGVIARPPLAFFLGGAVADLSRRSPPPNTVRAATAAGEPFCVKAIA